MKRVDGYKFNLGEVYIFSCTDMEDYSDSCVCGVYNDTRDGKIILEVMTQDNLFFEMWCTLPDKYRYVRLAKRLEIRNFSYSQCHYELSKPR